VKCTQKFGWKNLKRRDHLEDLDIDGRIGNIGTDLEAVECEDVDWIHLAVWGGGLLWTR